MRKIKFRIWDKQSKRFLQNDAGTHCISNWHIDVFTGEVVDFTASIGKFGFARSKSPNYYMDGTKVVKECPYVVQQFTGLLDKNGKEIFEGDILKWDGPHNLEFLASVAFSNGSFVAISNMPKVPRYNLLNHPAVIVGDIFKNHRLVE